MRKIFGAKAWTYPQPVYMRGGISNAKKISF